MPSSRRCIFGCDRDYPLFTVPKDDEVRLKWLDFMFGKGPPTKKNIYICGRHFTDDCFLNKSQFDSGLIGRLSLKEDAIPTLRSPLTSLALAQEAMRNFNATLESDRLIICHSPTSDNDGTSNIGVPVNPTTSDASDCSVSENNILRNTKNPDLTRKKADLPQVKNRYIVDEKQLLQLFSSQCPTCQSKVNMEKVVCGVVLTLNLRCPQCGFSKEWRNLESKNIPAADDSHQRENTVENASDSVPEFVYLVGEENDQMDLSDVSSGPSDKDSGEEWNPEDEIFFNEKLQTESDDEIGDGDEDIPSKHMELCTDCGKFFRKVKPHTCEHIVKPFSCNICGKRFINELSLIYHRKIHDASYEVSCKCCHMKFKTKADKTVHEHKHLTEEKPFKCPDCSETFETYNKRMIHLKEHRGPEDLKCQFCELEFSQIKHLRRHMVVHTGEKPYKCVVCERGFNQASNLKSHMRLHTGEKPYKCHYCDQAFNHNVSLKSHIKRFHTPDSENGQKSKKRKHDSGDYQDFWDKDPDSCLEDTKQDTDNDVQLEEAHRRKTKKNTGKPTGRQKINKADCMLQAEEAQEQSSGTDT